MGIDPPQLAWSTPLKLNDRQHQYVLDLLQLPEDEVERLAFFQAYLEDADTMLSRDAYDEFARAPYATVKKLKPKMNRDQLLAWIADPNVPPSRKRLYFTMLGRVWQRPGRRHARAATARHRCGIPLRTRCADRLLPHLARSRRRAA